MVLTLTQLGQPAPVELKQEPSLAVLQLVAVHVEQQILFKLVLVLTLWRPAQSLIGATEKLVESAEAVTTSEIARSVVVEFQTERVAPSRPEPLILGLFG